MKKKLLLGSVEADALSLVTFAQWNVNGLLIPLNCSGLIDKFTWLLETLASDFKFSLCNSALVAHYLLFQTHHWTPDEVTHLKELNRIKSIAELSEKILEQGTLEIENTFHCIKDLCSVLLQMNIMEFPSTSHDQACLENMSSSEMQLDEIAWIEQKSTLFDQSKAHIAMSEEWLQAYLSLKMGNRAIRPTLLKYGSHILAKRILFISNTLDLNLCQSDKIQLLEKNMPIFYLVLVLKK